MRFSLSWLRTHLDTDAALERITETLSAIGLEVEGVENAGAPLAAFRTARIVSAEQHPNADRLRVCMVDVGEAAQVQVVCGAPNARAGLATIFAPPGTVIPATGAALKIGRIRDVESRGMLCSLRELGLGEEHDGIAEIDAEVVPGLSYAAWAGIDDPVIEIAVTPNRGDALSVRGVARDLAAAGLGTLRAWAPAPVEGQFPSPVHWEITDHEACPWVLGRTIRGVANGPSPDWLQRRLRSIGLRPISRLVDVTNFFTIDLGRPLHVFDADRILGGVLTIGSGRTGTLAALNGEEITIEPADCVISDARGPRSIAGVMGGRDTGAEETTSNVFVECALFDPIRIARTGRRLGLVSDARQRFERGVDLALPPAALEAATRMIVELCGGEASEVVRAGAEPAWRREATLRFERIHGLGGLDLARETAAARLAALGFTAVAVDTDRITVAVPPWRNDVAGATPLEPDPEIDTVRAEELARAAAGIEAECDLLEEVLRLGGLDAIPAVSLPRVAPVPAPVLTEAQQRTALARRVLASRGLHEAVSFSFLDGATATLFAPDVDPAPVTLLNPIASDLDRLRPTPLASLLLAARRNAARGEAACGLFEIGAGFGTDGPVTIAAGLRTGAAARAPGRGAVAVTWAEARADVLAVLAALGVPGDALSTERVGAADAAWHPGRAGVVKQGPRNVLARFGALHPALLKAAGFEAPAAGFEILLDAIPAAKKRRRSAPDLPALQPVSRDFAFVVDRDTPAENVLRAARGAERNLIAAVALFDVYEGDKVAAGRKSVGVEVTIQPREKTLTDAEIEAVAQRITAAVAKATGALLRE